MGRMAPSLKHTKVTAKEPVSRSALDKREPFDVAVFISDHDNESDRGYGD